MWEYEWTLMGLILIDETSFTGRCFTSVCMQKADFKEVILNICRDVSFRLIKTV
jgi:hypothetical protein